MILKKILELIIPCLLVIGMFSCGPQIESKLSIVPKPALMEEGQGNLVLDAETKIVYDTTSADLQQIAGPLVKKLRHSTGYPFQVVDNTQVETDNGNIRLAIDEAGLMSSLGTEGYELTVDTLSVNIAAASPAGLFYGVQTLYQLLPPEIESAVTQSQDMQWLLPAVQIVDKPRFTWRGLHLDVGRHFMPVEFVKKYIDLLSYHKMNMFHWHLTEDQGWRIEIKKYPKLTQISAFRKETVVGHNRDKPRKFDGQRYGGFYTQDEIRDVVAYAKERFVTVVPEIEMPGHSVAVLAAYPQLSCTGGPFEVATFWGINKDIFCAGNDSTFVFLENVLNEVMDLFPSEFIHIGGDEAPKDRWKACPKCQARIQAEGLKDEEELQSYFIRRIEKFLNAKNRRLIGWDEILEGGLAPNATVMSWRGIKGGMAAADQEHDVVMTPNTYCYFDYYQAKSGEPLAIGGFLPLETVYSFEPIPPDLTADKQKHILGAQGNVWTEYIKTPQYAEYMTYPRACALAEVVWSKKEDRNYADFIKRMDLHQKRLSEKGVNYRPIDD